LFIYWHIIEKICCRDVTVSAGALARTGLPAQHRATPFQECAMTRVDRRQFITTATALGATILWAGPSPAASRIAWRERRELFPEGVASGDPEPHSVILWTRRPFAGVERSSLTAEIALDAEFRRVVATVEAPVLAEADWTCRVLAAGLSPATVYW
jgi:alkaline phosphatase D